MSDKQVPTLWTKMNNVTDCKGQAFQSILNGMNIIVLPDDDDLLKDVEDGCMGSDGVRYYIGETLWTKVKDVLISNM